MPLRRLTLAAAALAALALTAGAPVARAAGSGAPRLLGGAMMGGLKPVEDLAREDVQAVAQFAAGELSKLSNRLGGVALAEENGGVVSCSTQVVAGTMFHCVLKSAHDELWEVKVWRKLDGTYELSDSKLTKAEQ